MTGPGRRPSAGLLAMNRAVELITGVEGAGDPMEFAGRTDTQIARMLLQIAGEPEPTAERVDRLVGHYVEGLASFVAPAPYSPIGDPRRAARELEAHGGIVGLGTGNVRTGADVKLTSAGIRDLFDLDRGGFGEDGLSRAEVLRVGARRCDPGRNLPVVVVGDTPRDVAAALEIGALCVGTPYHRNTADILRSAGAHGVVDQVGLYLAQEIVRLVSAI
ncbi:MAG: HAD family hydrolase [Deltaproteobacteria bacterium]|nr:HAD family hydrolase [Deltaproteobacteria bacterium]